MVHGSIYTSVLIQGRGLLSAFSETCNHRNFEACPVLSNYVSPIQVKYQVGRVGQCPNVLSQLKILGI